MIFRQSAEKEIINIKIKKDVYELMRKHLLQSDGDNESFCFLYCYESVSKNVKTYYPHVIVPIEKNSFIAKDRTYMKLNLDAMHAAYTDFIMDKDFSCLISCHSHPFDKSGRPHFSSTDDNNDKEQASWFYNELTKHQNKYKKEGTQIEYLHLVIGQKGLNARKYNIKTKKFDYINKVTVFSDDDVDFFFPSNKDEHIEKVNNIFSRTDKAFGNKFTKTTSNLAVGIIGAGGIGSIISEGIARLGIKKILLIDPDKVEATNLNRLQGASINDIGKYKVDVLKNNLDNYFSNTIEVDCLKENVVSETVISILKDVDIIIGSVDNHQTRFFLNRFSVQYLIPYLDAATQIIPNETEISVIARAAIIIPSITTCMDCSFIKYYDFKDVYFATAPDIIKNEIKKAGYITGNADIVNPAVYPQNLAVSGLILMEFMNIITGYKPLYNNVFLDYSKLGEKQVLASKYYELRQENRKEGCMNCDEYLGKGDSLNFLTSPKIDFSGLNN